MKIPIKKIYQRTKTFENKIVTPLSKKIAIDYLDALFENDIDAILSNYTKSSIVITLEKTYRGLSEIREFTMELIKYFSKKNTVLVLDKITIEKDIIYMVWHTNSTTTNITIASDTFYIKNKKIKKHTFICQLNRKY